MARRAACCRLDFVMHKESRKATSIGRTNTSPGRIGSNRAEERLQETLHRAFESRGETGAHQGCSGRDLDWHSFQ